MTETAALLADTVLPEQPLRQWVLSLPMALRFLLVARPAVLSEVLGVVYRTISGHLQASAGVRRAAGHTGAVTLIQRFGSALNLSVHFHMIFIDGVYVPDAAGELVFRAARSPSADALEALVQRLAQRIGEPPAPHARERVRAAAGSERHDESHRPCRKRTGHASSEGRRGRRAGGDPQAGCRQPRVHCLAPGAGGSMAARKRTVLRHRGVWHGVGSRVEDVRGVLDRPPAFRARGGVRAAPLPGHLLAQRLTPRRRRIHAATDRGGRCRRCPTRTSASCRRRSAWALAASASR